MGGALNARVVPFEAGDGFPCNLIHVQGPKPPVKGPVMATTYGSRTGGPASI